MDFRLGDDQRALKKGVRDLLEGVFGREELRAAVERPALDRALWRELGRAGFFSLRLAETEGGVGLGLPEAVVVFEEAGRALLPGPLVATHLLAGVVAGAAEGERVVGLCDATARPMLWEHPSDCDELVVLGADGESSYRCEPEWLTAEPVRSVDPLTPLARVVSRPRRARGSRRSRCEPDAASLRRRAALLTAAQQLGGAGRTVETAVEYAGQREQFGAPIGSFQAVKHLCARMLVRTEVARSAVYAASVTESALDVAAAKLLADDAAVRNARDCLQVHGGMGFTWEADVHLYLKRAWLRAEQWQKAAEAEEALADGLLADLPDS